MLSEIKTVATDVEFILKNYKKTRDSDKLLWLTYMCIKKNLQNTIDKGSYSDFEELILDKSTPTFESISRARRKIQEMNSHLQGKYRKKRIKESNRTRRWAGYMKKIKDLL